jgi:glutaredoxin
VATFVENMKRATQTNALDITSDEDLGIAIMNLISIEEHLFFTANKTGKSHYYELLREVREMRKELLKQIVLAFEGEVWCISKHLLASSMRLMEVGTKELTIAGLASARPYFDKSYRLFRMFWEIVLRQPGRPGEAPTAVLPAKKLVVIFYEPTCPHCKVLEGFLASNHLDEAFDVIRKDVTSDAANRAELEAVHRTCLKDNGELSVPVVIQDGRCAMGEEEAIRLFKSLMWDNVKELKQSLGPLLKQAGVPAHVQSHAEHYDDAVDAAMSCCKE